MLAAFRRYIEAEERDNTDCNVSSQRAMAFLGACHIDWRLKADLSVGLLPLLIRGTRLK
jgi:hypothetical protein